MTTDFGNQFSHLPRHRRAHYSILQNDYKFVSKELSVALV